MKPEKINKKKKKKKRIANLSIGFGSVEFYVRLQMDQIGNEKKEMVGWQRQRQRQREIRTIRRGRRKNRILP